MPLAAISMNFMNDWVEGISYVPPTWADIDLDPVLLGVEVRGARHRRPVPVLLGAAVTGRTRVNIVSGGLAN